MCGKNVFIKPPNRKAKMYQLNVITLLLCKEYCSYNWKKP